MKNNLVMKNKNNLVYKSELLNVNIPITKNCSFNSYEVNYKKPINRNIKTTAYYLIL